MREVPISLQFCAGSVRESPDPSFSLEKVVPATGLEPVQCYLLEPESSASANSATRATEILEHAGHPAPAPGQTLSHSGLGTQARFSSFQESRWPITDQQGLQ